MHAMIELLRSGIEDVETLTVHNVPLSVARTVSDEPGVVGVNILLFDEQDECVARWRWHADDADGVGWSPDMGVPNG